MVALATSGTALANYLPAVIEADLSLIPLILISADRPPELLHVGANQTIDQVGIFGEKGPLVVCDPPAGPDLDSNAYWRSTVSQTMARAKGPAPGPARSISTSRFGEPTVPVSDDGRTRAEPYRYPIDGRAR